MLTLITPAVTLTAANRMQLANLWAEHQFGPNWDADLDPFDQHTEMWMMLDELSDIAEGSLPDHRLVDDAA